MRVGIYLRVSTFEQSVELQQREILEYVKVRGWTQIKTYEDTGKSGTTGNRIALKQLLQDSRERKLDLIICWKLDRLFRSLKDLIQTLQGFDDVGVKFIALKDNVDLSSSQGKLFMHLIGAFAEFEANLIKERIKAGLLNAKAKGKQLGRPRTRNDLKIRGLRASGLSIKQIAAQVTLSTATVKRSLSGSKTLSNPMEKVQ